MAKEQLPFDPYAAFLGLMGGGIGGLGLGAILAGPPESNVAPYVSPMDIPLSPYDLQIIQSVSGSPSLMSEDTLAAMFQASPEDFRPFLGASLEQQAAMNAISQQQYDNWLGMINDLTGVII